MTKKKNKWCCIHEERRFSPGKTSSFTNKSLGFWLFCLVLTWRNPQMAISVREWSSTKRSWVAYFQTNPYCCCNHRFRRFSLGFAVHHWLNWTMIKLGHAVYWGVASSHIRFQRSRCVWRMGMRQNLRMVRYYKWQVKWLGENHNPDFCLLWVNCSFSRPLGFFWSQYSVKNYGLSKNPEMFSKQLNHKKFSCWLVYWLVIDGYWITPSPIQSTFFFVCGSKTSCFQAGVKKLSERVRPEAGGVRCGCEESKGCGTFFGFRPSKLWGYRCVFFYMDEFDHDLTVLPHWKSWLIRGIIPKWPQDSGWWNIIIYPYIYIHMLFTW